MTEPMEVVHTDDAVMGEIFCLQDQAVLERVAGGRLIRRSPVPAWFRALVPRAEDFPACMPFVDSFLVDAGAFWDRGQPGILQGGLSLETTVEGRPVAVDVSAVVALGRAFLVLARRGDFVQLQAQIQRSREQALELHAQEKILQEMQRSEQSLQATKAALESTMRDRTLFLAQVSHEIRTPLSAILGYAVLMQMDGPLTEKAAEDLRAIRSAGEALMALLNDLLDVSKVEAGHLELEYIPFAPVAVVQDGVQILQVLAREKGIGLTVTGDGDRGGGGGETPWIVGDPVRFRQVLLNLLTNAIKFTSRGGVHVRVQGEGLPDGRVQVRVEVQDTGIGVPADRVGRLFQPFTQADASVARRFGGTGLGLSLSKRLAEAMGGEIGFTSQEGVGSTFWFTVRGAAAQPPTNREQTVALPAARLPKGTVPSAQVERERMERQQAARAVDSASSPPAGAAARTPQPASTQTPEEVQIPRGLRVLFAEDAPMNRFIALRLLQKLGCDVETVADGRQAIDTAACGSFDLVLLDVQMPVVDGLAALQAIRQLPGSRGEVPIVFLTGTTVESELETLRTSGAHGVLSKPLRLEDLQGVLRRYVRPQARP